MNLTEKELTALEEELSQEQLLVKKYQAMACLVTDAPIRQQLNDCAAKHQQHFNTLASFLQ